MQIQPQSPIPPPGGNIENRQPPPPPTKPVEGSESTTHDVVSNVDSTEKEITGNHIDLYV